MTIFPLRAAAFLAATWIALAPAAVAAAAAAPASEPAPAARAEEWRGRFCTRSGCGPAAAARWSDAAGFGAVVLVTGLLARRRAAPRD